MLCYVSAKRLPRVFRNCQENKQHTVTRLLTFPKISGLRSDFYKYDELT